MQLDWQQLFGSTSTFGINFGLASPRNAGEFGFEGAASAFGLFEMWVGGRCLTRNQHAHDDRERTHVLWSILEVAEWFASAWPAMMHEVRFPYSIESASDGIDWINRSLTQLRLGEDISDQRLKKRHEWWSRHCLRATGGVALPNVSVRRVWNRVEISWDNQQGVSPRADIVWVEQRGIERCGLEEVANTLRSALIGVGEAIEERERGNAQALVETARALGTSPWEYKAWLGFDDAFKGFKESGRVLRMNNVAVAASGNAGVLTKEDLDTIESSLAGLSGKHCTLDRRVSPVPLTQPWVSGYELAADFREKQGWADDPVPDLGKYLTGKGVKVQEITLSADDIHGLCAYVEPGFAGIWLNRGSRRYGHDWAQQMLLAHELCHLLFDETEDKTLSLLSGPQTDWLVEARANAFAAAVLMPPNGVVAELGSGPIDAAGVKRVMSRFGTGSLATTLHLKNLGHMDDDSQAVVLRELQDA
jgi:Zn-dependent peptidase ImmA (M78 family)